MVFSWDEKKRKLNLAKHGIDFRDAETIFDGPLVTVEDSREDYGAAVYAERNDRVRIISIRKALKHEARFFFSQIGK